MDKTKCYLRIARTHVVVRSWIPEGRSPGWKTEGETGNEKVRLHFEVNGEDEEDKKTAAVNGNG